MKLPYEANSELTLDPVATDRTEEVGVQAVWLFNLVQYFSDVHHLQRYKVLWSRYCTEIVLHIQHLPYHCFKPGKPPAEYKY